MMVDHYIPIIFPVQRLTDSTPVGFDIITNSRQFTLMTFLKIGFYYYCGHCNATHGVLHILCGTFIEPPGFLIATVSPRNVEIL